MGYEQHRICTDPTAYSSYAGGYALGYYPAEGFAATEKALWGAEDLWEMGESFWDTAISSVVESGFDFAEFSVSDQTDSTFTISGWHLATDTAPTVLELSVDHSEEAGQSDQEDDGDDVDPP